MDIQLIGFVSGALTTLSFVPQVARVWKTRSTRDISLAMYSIFVSGTVGWVIYGCLTRAWPVVAANVLTTLLAAAVILMKLRFEQKSG